MTINLSILLIPYFIFLAFWLLFSLISIYHMLRYGFKGFVTPIIVVAYCALSFFILSTSAMYLYELDWNQELFILDSVLIPGNFKF